MATKQAKQATKTATKPVTKFDDKTKYNAYGLRLDKRNNEQIDATKADFRMVVGRRSNGKTYPSLVNGVKNFIDSGCREQFAYVRRWDDDLKKNAPQLFNGLVQDGWLSWYSKGKWNGITYYRRCWYLIRTNSDGAVEEKCKQPLAYGFAVNMAERYKGPDYPHIKTIIFDEFIPERTAGGTIVGEWRLWNSILSTIIRERNDVVVYMIANTITKNSPYFHVYKIDIDAVEPGSICVYRYSGGGTLALEYCTDSGETNRSVSKYFDIEDSATGNMIMRGQWETDAYPRLPRKLSHKSRTVMKIWLRCEGGKVVQGNIIETDYGASIFWHPKTTPLQFRYGDYVYLSEWDNDYIDSPTVRSQIDTSNQLDRLILRLIVNNRCYYANNDTGEKVKYFFKLK